MKVLLLELEYFEVSAIVHYRKHCPINIYSGSKLKLKISEELIWITAGAEERTVCTTCMADALPVP